MIRRLWLPVLILILALAALLSSLVQVQPGEVVVLRRLGRLVPHPLTPGLHLSLPLGLETRARVRLDAVRRLDLGLVHIAGPEVQPSAGEFLTGDQNFVRLRAVVQYRVSNPSDYVLRASDHNRLLHDLALASLTRALASLGIDAILGPDRLALARSARDHLQSSATKLRLGVSILNVHLTDLQPPREVASAFADAQAARSDAARRHREALAYIAASKPAASASSAAILDRARADSTRALAQAQARASRFLQLLETYRRSPALSARALYLDTLRTLLAAVPRKIVLAPHEPVDLTLYEESPDPPPRP